MDRRKFIELMGLSLAGAALPGHWALWLGRWGTWVARRGIDAPDALF